MTTEDSIEKALDKLVQKYALEEHEIIFLRWYCDLIKEERQKLFPKIEISALGAIREMLNE